MYRPPNQANVWSTTRTASETVSDRMALLRGGDSSIAVPLGEDLEDRDGVVASAHEGIDVVLQTELFPPSPMSVRCFGTFSSDAKSDLFIDNAEISAGRVNFAVGRDAKAVSGGNAN
jgi:hypothetical protein